VHACTRTSRVYKNHTVFFAFLSLEADAAVRDPLEGEGGLWSRLFIRSASSRTSVVPCIAMILVLMLTSFCRDTMSLEWGDKRFPGLDGFLAVPGLTYSRFGCGAGSRRPDSKCGCQA